MVSNGLSWLHMAYILFVKLVRLTFRSSNQHFYPNFVFYDVIGNDVIDLFSTVVEAQDQIHKVSRPKTYPYFTNEIFKPSKTEWVLVSSYPNAFEMSIYFRTARCHSSKSCSAM